MLFSVLFVSCNKDEQTLPLVNLGNRHVEAQDVSMEVPNELWTYLSDDEKDAILNKLINQELILQEVEKRGLHKDPDVKRRLEDAQKEIYSQIFDDIIIQPRINITDDDVNEYYRRNQVQFVRDNDEVHLYHLIFPEEELADSALAMIKERRTIRDEMLERLEKQAEEQKTDTSTADSIEVDSTEVNEPIDSIDVETIMSEIDDFKNIAAAFNLDTTDIDIGYIDVDGILPSIRKKVESAHDGDIIGPVKTDRGYVILNLIEYGRAGTLYSLEQVKPKIEDLLYAEMNTRIKSDLVDSLREFYQPQVNPVLWDSLLNN